jgi:hypothetical protein
VTKSLPVSTLSSTVVFRHTAAFGRVRRAALALERTCTTKVRQTLTAVASKMGRTPTINTYPDH